MLQIIEHLSRRSHLLSASSAQRGSYNLGQSLGTSGRAIALQTSLAASSPEIRLEVI